MFKILVINPGSTSTEIALFEGEREGKSMKAVHPIDELRRFTTVLDQFPYRREIVQSQFTAWGVTPGSLDAVIGRSALRGKKTGVYEVNERMIEDLRAVRMESQHASILGGLLARDIADDFRVPAFVGHIAFQNLPPLATVSGHPLIKRVSAYHAQNIEAVAWIAARELKKEPTETNLVIAHLEGGMSIAALEGGTLRDVTSALDEGPFTTERSGTLPCNALIELCFSGRYTKAQMLKMIRGEGGIVAYLGTNKIDDVEKGMRGGNEQAAFYLEAMCYQIAKDIAAMASVLKGRVDAVVLTGKLLLSPQAVAWIEERVRFIAPVKTYPEEEMAGFARAALRVLRGEEQPIAYE